MRKMVVDIVNNHTQNRSSKIYQGSFIFFAVFMHMITSFHFFIGELVASDMLYSELTGN